jgi:MOSC domain-containing protein YiiM
VASLLAQAGWWWREATRTFEDAELNRRPGPEVWSVLEYGIHSALACAVLRDDIERMLAEDGCAIPEETVVPIGEASEDNWAVLDREATLDDIEREGAALAELAVRPGAPWDNVGFLPDRRLQAGAVLIHAAHDSSHHQMDVSRGLAAVSGTSSAGIVAQINASDGGVPKLPVPNATVTIDGMRGDRQRDHKHHGRPFQAVCLWSADVIDELASAGHPIGPGSAGENLTLRGVQWESLRPGARLRVGEELLVELSFDAVPCHNQAQWFSDGDYSRISWQANPQWVRWYGWVREEGAIRVGDRVVVEA